MPQTDRSVTSLLKQLETLRSRLSEQQTFRGEGPHDLWIWQQQQLRRLCDALLLDLPGVYAPPRFAADTQVVAHSPVHGYLETEKGVWIELGWELPLQSDGSTAVVVFDSGHPLTGMLAASIIEQQAAALTFQSRAAVLRTRYRVTQLCGKYLAVGKTYVGSCVADCLRVIDYWEDRLGDSGVKMGCVAFGADALIAAAAMALDKRIRALVLIEPAAGEDEDGVGIGYIGGGGFCERLHKLLCCCAPRDVQVLNASTAVQQVCADLSDIYMQCERPDSLELISGGDINAARPVSFLSAALSDV